jgi:hypothetical protein
MRLYESKTNIKPLKTYKDITLKQFVSKFMISPTLDTPKDKLKMVNGVIFHEEFTTILGYDTLFFDYDSKEIPLTFDEVKAIFMKYECEFYMYTSSSHSESIEKCRVMVPLKNVLSETLRSRSVKLFRRKFIGVDNCSFNRNQRFYIPVKNNDLYKFYGQPGKLITFGELLGFKDDESLLKSLDNTDKWNNVFTLIKSKPISYNTTKNNDKSWSPSMHKHVTYFMNTCFKSGGGNLPTFNAMLIAMKYNDEQLFEQIITKAKSEGWTTYELDQKIKSINKIIAGNK